MTVKNMFELVNKAKAYSEKPELQNLIRLLEIKARKTEIECVCIRRCESDRVANVTWLPL